MPVPPEVTWSQVIYIAMMRYIMGILNYYYGMVVAYIVGPVFEWQVAWSHGRGLYSPRLMGVACTDVA